MLIAVNVLRKGSRCRHYSWFADAGIDDDARCTGCQEGQVGAVNAWLT